MLHDVHPRPVLWVHTVRSITRSTHSEYTQGSNWRIWTLYL